MKEVGWARTAVIVVNSHAGAITGELTDRVVRQCRSLVDDVEVAHTAYPGHASEIAAKAAHDGTDMIVPIGGDGTVTQVAAGLARACPQPSTARPAMQVVPAGTGNSFYREIWSDQPHETALQSALTRSHRREIDMARIEETDTLVLLGACSGLVAEALVTAAGLTGVTGRDRYQRAVAVTLADFAPHSGRVTVDGQVLHDGSVILANVGGGRYRGGSFMVLPRSLMDDGLLDVCVVTGDLNLPELPGLTRDGRHVDRPEVHYRRGRRIVVERTDGRPLTFEHDGEVMRSPGTRYTLDVLPAAVSVLA